MVLTVITSMGDANCLCFLKNPASLNGTSHKIHTGAPDVA